MVILNLKENIKKIPNHVQLILTENQNKIENIIIDNSKKYKFKFIIFRYFLAVGKHVSNKVKKKNYLNLFEKIKKSILEKKLFEIHGNNLSTTDGTPERDFIHVYDVVGSL